MQKIIYPSEYFNIIDTLECGQIFRFSPFKEGFLVFSADKCSYVYQTEKDTVIECEDCDKEYFINYFDLKNDYSLIVNSALSENNLILSKSVKLGKGLRILNQDSQETLFSFIVSQNNNILRIKGILNKLCLTLGDKKEFMGQVYYTFPTPQKMAGEKLSFYRNVGLGYRAGYIKGLADNIMKGFDVNTFKNLDDIQLKNRLLSIKGVGEKVCNCVMLFGFKRTKTFPVDTWIEKVYRENFNGKLTNRVKITEFFIEKYKDNAGYYQQYLFYYKRSKEKSIKGE